MQYSPAAFVAKWNPLFKPNTTGDIEEVDLQAFAQDIADSFAGGKSAYQLWLDAGYKGTVEDFLTYLRGKDAQSLYELWLAQGNIGSASMFLLSLKGSNGKTAYELWLESGNSGSILQFLNSLKGASAYDIWLAAGNVGSYERYLNSLRGFTGKSAYELWLDAGNQGSVTTFLNSLIGPKGDNAVLFRILAVLDVLPQSGTGGEGYIVDGHVWVWLTGSAKWYDMGPTSVPGLSAYQVAVQNGFVGTEAQWLASLVGKTNYQIAQANGYIGTEAQWLATLVGPAGKNAFEIAQLNGYPGTQAEWLVSLKGADGRSAYQVAQANGYPGTEAQWLASLKGPDGRSAYQVAVDNGFTGTEPEWLETLKSPNSEIDANALANKADKDLTIFILTDSYNLKIEHRSGLVCTNFPFENILTIPLNSEVPFPVGTQIILMQNGDGQTTVMGAPGVTLRNNGGKYKFAGRDAGATLIQVALNVWVIFGDLIG